MSVLKIQTSRLALSNVAITTDPEALIEVLSKWIVRRFVLVRVVSGRASLPPVVAEMNVYVRDASLQTM